MSMRELGHNSGFSTISGPHDWLSILLWSWTCVISCRNHDWQPGKKLMRWHKGILVLWDYYIIALIWIFMYACTWDCNIIQCSCVYTFNYPWRFNKGIIWVRRVCWLWGFFLRRRIQGVEWTVMNSWGGRIRPAVLGPLCYPEPL